MHKYKIDLKSTISSDSRIKSWLIDEERLKKEDIRNDLQHPFVKWVSADQLSTEIGVLSWKLDGETGNETLKKICSERGYKNSDEKEIGLHLSNYSDMIKTFATEHIHSDGEIRYVLKGSGYFDVRNKKDEWVRIQVTKGDLLILPEGIYHRYIPDITNYILVMRLFTEEPKWTPINRPCEDHESRKKYLSNFQKN